MTDQDQHSDRIAEGYLRWWAPVLAHDAVATLDLVAADVAAGARHLLDVGVGTGTLGLAAVERWPGIQVVGIGASAGGLEAFTGLLQNLPPDTGLAFVLVQHMAPRSHSLLPEILTRVTRMPVIEVKDGLKVEPNHVYVSPPEVVMSIEAGALHLLTREVPRGLHRPVDYFLPSLAADQGGRAIGVILSGTASDGVKGMMV